MKKIINMMLMGIAILAILATLVLLTIEYYNLFQKQIRNDLATTANLLKDSNVFESVDVKLDEIDLSEDIQGLRITWIDEDGTVLYDNDALKDTLSNHMDRPEIQEAFATGKGESVRKSDTMNQNTYYYAILLNNGTVLRVATNAQSLFSVFLSASPVILVIILIIIIMCVCISHILTRQLISPIEIMAENLENEDYESPYKELDPLSEKLKAQHTDVLLAAKARQDFTANVSHELKTPLTAISGYAELLERDMVCENQRHHFYREIRKNSNRLISLINDTIRLSELDQKNYEILLEDLDLFNIVNECIEELIVNAQQQSISLTYDGGRAIVHGNREMLKELVENLVQNAIRYNNPDGKVQVLVTNKENHAILVVKDNGIGIPVGEQDRIFERFYRVDKSRSKATGGTGLGLAIVKHIVEIHNAKIEVDSALDVGTTMTVLF